MKVNIAFLKNNQSTSLTVLVFVSGFFSVVNFFLTKNPYTASHSGLIMPDGVAISYSMLFSPSLLASISLLITYLIICRLSFRISLAICAWLFFSFLSGFVNGVMFFRPFTYIFDGFSLLLIGSLALCERTKSLDRSLLLILWFISIATLIGIILSLIRPSVWGVFQFGFSREVRGENVFGNMIGSALIPALAVGLKNLKLKTRILFFCIGFLNQLGSGSRVLILGLRKLKRVKT